ncbi:hypothetical protein [Nocardia puris]|uniref:Uncharacterized protein n=1 Tax=Nocardia puris TaxID=208602 RepID=A0A366DMJ2_9NOCA|nr:hypothetical protein [Nocardia puris]RBO91313.1 hypothetical protein DFR74_10415 [Nocardia puris]
MDLLIVVVALLVGTGPSMAEFEAGPLHIAPAVVDAPAEDDPTWDCRTMGNRICGPHLSVRPWGHQSGQVR